jgi:SAM-dependent methyltransferase
VTADPPPAAPGATSDYDLFAPFYDLEFADFLDDLPLYAGFAERAGGPVLELGCGTGRLLLPLALAGHRLTGVDLSSAMLARARARLEAAGVAGRVTLVADDMRSLARLGAARFRLVFCAINSFLHLPDQPAHLAALHAARARLEPGGWLILDLLHPHPALLAGYDGRLTREARLTDPATGEAIEKYAWRTVDAATQTIQAGFIYDRLAKDGTLRRVTAPFATRYIHRYELELLLARAGFVVEELLGGHGLEPFTSESGQMIAVARPRA